MNAVKSNNIDFPETAPRKEIHAGNNTKIMFNNMEKEAQERLFQRNKTIKTAFLFTFISMVISFTNQSRQSLLAALTSKIQQRNQWRLLIYCTEYLILIIISFSLNSFKIPKCRSIYVLISILCWLETFIKAYGYTINHFEYYYLVLIWNVLITTCYKLVKTHCLYTTVFGFGLLFALLANILQLIIGYFETNSVFDSDNLKYIYHNKDNFNNIWVIIHSLLFSGIMFWQELYLTTNRKIKECLIFNGVLCLCGCFWFSLIHGEFAYISSSFSSFSLKFCIEYLGLLMLAVVICVIAPFYIRKCSAVAYATSLSAMLFWRFIVNFIFYNNWNFNYYYKAYSLDLSEHYFSLVLYMIGVFGLCFDSIRNKGEKKEEEEDENEEEEVDKKDEDEESNNEEEKFIINNNNLRASGGYESQELSVNEKAEFNGSVR